MSTTKVDPDLAWTPNGRTVTHGTCHIHGEYKRFDNLFSCPICATEDAVAETQKPSEGTKNDDGKPLLALLPVEALTEVGKVMTFGAKKYDAHNWRKGFAYTRVASAALRHLFAWISGEDTDSESGLSHLAHCACCILFLLTFTLTKTGSDDRYKGHGV